MKKYTLKLTHEEACDIVMALWHSRRIEHAELSKYNTETYKMVREKLKEAGFVNDKNGSGK